MLWEYSLNMPANVENASVATGLEKVRFHSSPKERPKNAETTAQLHSFHMLARSCSKSSKLVFKSMWTENFQMCKLDLEKAEKPEINLPQHLLDHRKSKRIPEKHLLLLHYYTKAFDCVDHNKLWKILEEMGIPDQLTCLLRCRRSRSNS